MMVNRNNTQIGMVLTSRKTQILYHACMHHPPPLFSLNFAVVKFGQLEMAVIHSFIANGFCTLNFSEKKSFENFSLKYKPLKPLLRQIKLRSNCSARMVDTDKNMSQITKQKYKSPRGFQKRQYQIQFEYL